MTIMSRNLWTTEVPTCVIRLIHDEQNKRIKFVFNFYIWCFYLLFAVYLFPLDIETM